MKNGSTERHYSVCLQVLGRDGRDLDADKLALPGNDRIKGFIVVHDIQILNVGDELVV